MRPRGAQRRAGGRAGSGGAGAAPLTLAALALVLASAALHAGWNALVADAEDTHATTAVALLVGAAVFALPAALTWRVEAEAWPYIAASAVLELAYFALLAAVYSRADLSVRLSDRARLGAGARAADLASIALGAPVGARGRGGRAGRDRRRAARARRRARMRRTRPRSALALGVGACIAGYTLVDDHGVRHAAALPYFELILVACALPYAAAVARHPRHRALRAAADARAAAAGVGMVAAYLLVLEALERAEAAPVAALRETSVVMATVGAALVGRERVPARGSPAPCSSWPAWPRSRSASVVAGVEQGRAWSGEAVND